MSVLAPWGLLALLGVPAVLALYLLRRRHERRRVAALWLFVDERTHDLQGRRLTRPRQSASLWLEVAAALLMALGVAGLARKGGAPAHIVFVLDDHYAMQARLPGGETVLERAQAAIEEALREAGQPERVTVVTAGREPEIALGPRASRTALERWLDDWQPAAERSEREPALDLALTLAGSGAPVCYVTDRPPQEAPEGVEVRAVGAPLENAALLGATRLDAPESSAANQRLLVELARWGEGTKRLELEVALSDDQGRVRRRLAQPELTLESGKTQALELPLVRTTLPVRVALASGDALSVDDVRYVLPERDEPLKWASLLAPSVSASLELERGLDAVGDFVRAAPERADVVFLTPGVNVPARAWRTEVVVHVPAASDPLVLAQPPFWIEAGEPLTRGLSFADASWVARAGRLPGEALIEAPQAVLVSIERPERPGAPLRLHLNIDPERADVVHVRDWPVWLSNLAMVVRTRLPGLERRNVALGDAVRWRAVDGAPRPVLLVGTEGERIEAEGGRDEGEAIVRFLPRRAGLYRLLDADARVLEQVALYLGDAHTSNLQRGASGHKPASSSQQHVFGGEREAQPLWAWLAVLALLCVIMDLLVLRRAEKQRTLA